MKTAKDLFTEYIEQELTEALDGLKDEFKKIPILFNREADKRMGATTNYLTNPPTIVFHINALEETYRAIIIESLKKLIIHELIHSIKKVGSWDESEREEIDAYFKQNILKFFKE